MTKPHPAVTETILLVEDDEAVAAALARALSARGYRVIVATSGHKAVCLADEHCGPIHLVISDVVMPKMSGIQLFDRLRTWYPAIRFLFISGFNDAPISRNHFDDGRTSFLAKPFAVGELVGAIRSLLDAESHQPALLV
jgi:DNA-binding NtrC family response regulator